MEEEEFLAIEDALREVCLRVGAPELTEDRFYVRRSGIEPERLLTAKDRVVAQVEALERHMSLYDRGTYDNAMDRIQTVLQQSILSTERDAAFPAGAIVIVPGRAGAGEDIFDLQDLPDLERMRQDLRMLANRLRES